VTNAYLSPSPKQRFFDNNGNPAVNGTLSTFAAGTSTPIATYTDNTAGTPNTNPITLNFRGECDLWLKPNIAYKLQLNDASGVLIWTVDQIINSNLITLYGGVDSGTTNAYVLNFTASFAAYTDGIIIYWVPNATNTGPSTINVNGLGVVNIVNPDGSALVASEIVANNPAQILFKGGAFQLITPAATVYGSFTPTWGGFSATPSTTSIPYRKNGTLVTLLFVGTGTSNSTSFTISGVPAVIRPSSFLGVVPCFGMRDNGANLANGAAVVDGIGTITFFKDGTQVSNWTAAGNKGFSGQSLIVYSL
jgi:hypothetical protein